MKKRISVEQALKEIQEGKMVILVDNEDRENEGDLVMAGCKVKAEHINFMATHGRGLICVTLEREQVEKLQIPMQLKDGGNDSPFETPFTMSVEATKGVTTGISAADRARTIEVCCDPNAKPSDLVTPGHMFPLKARRGGVLERQGQTEGSLDLAKMAGLFPAGVIVEILNKDGTMARRPELDIFAEKHNLSILSVEDIRRYRIKNESTQILEAEAKLPTKNGNFIIQGYKQKYTKEETVALVKGEPKKVEAPLVRLHSQCQTGEVFHSLRCDCEEQLALAQKRIEQEGDGVILYLFQEGRGIGLINKIKAYNLQDSGADTIEGNTKQGLPTDARLYDSASAVLHEMGIKKVRLLTNNPLKKEGLEQYGIEVTEMVSHEGEINKHNASYLKTKKDKMGHKLNRVE